MKLIAWFKNNWMFIAVLGFLAFLNYLYLSPLESLPSPIYGGDYYYQLGQTNHFKFGGNPFESATILGALPGYFVLYTLGAGLIAKLGFDAIVAHFIFSYIILLLGAIVFYTLVNKLFKSKVLGIVGVLMFFMADKFPILKYTPFAELLIMPLIILLLYNFIKDTSKRNILFLGIGFGLAGLTHSISFIGSTFLIFFAFLWYGLRSNDKQVCIIMNGIMLIGQILEFNLTLLRMLLKVVCLISLVFFLHLFLYLLYLGLQVYSFVVKLKNLELKVILNFC